MGSLIFIVIIIVIIAVIAYTLYSRTGSGINPRPHDGTDGAPGAKGPEELSGRDEGEGSTLDQHGTK